MAYRYVSQPIQVHPTRALQNFRRGKCDPYENPYVRTGTNLALPNILILRGFGDADFGQPFAVLLYDMEDISRGSMANPGFAYNFLDAPNNQYEAVTYDRGTWTIPNVPDGLYYIRFFSVFGGVTYNYYSDEILITAGLNGFPLPCNDNDNWIEYRFRQPGCVTSGRSILGSVAVDILAYPEGMDFFLFLKDAGLANSEWETDKDQDKDGSQTIINNSIRADKRWNLQGGQVSEAIIDSFQASAVFDFVEISYASLIPVLFDAFDVTVEAGSDNGGCTYDYSCKFLAVNNYLLKQGCCP